MQKLLLLLRELFLGVDTLLLQVPELLELVEGLIRDAARRWRCGHVLWLLLASILVGVLLAPLLDLLSGVVRATTDHRGAKKRGGR